MNLKDSDFDILVEQLMQSRDWTKTFRMYFNDSQSQAEFKRILQHLIEKEFTNPIMEALRRVVPRAKSNTARGRGRSSLGYTGQLVQSMLNANITIDPALRKNSVLIDFDASNPDDVQLYQRWFKRLSEQYGIVLEEVQHGNESLTILKR